jgi:antitoxin MazE
MFVQLAKWGNTLAVRIPAAYAREIGMSENGQAELSIEHGTLVLKPRHAVPYFDLDEVIARITEDNRHEEIAAGPAVGEEFA